MRSVKSERARSARCFSLKASSLFSFLTGSEFQNVFLARQTAFQPLLFLLSVLGPTGSAPVDSCGHSQETSAPNLQIGSLPTQVRLRARAVSNLLGRSLSWVVSSRRAWLLALYTPTICQPSSSGLTRPVRQRHRSTAICRAIATMAFFLAAFVALAWPTTRHHFFTSLLWGCQITKRQASSMSAVRSRTLPCLVMDKRCMVLPLALTPPHRPV